MLTVGVDTYVTVQEAEEYLRNLPLCHEISMYSHFLLQPTASQENSLRLSCLQLETLSYVGRKSNPEQKLSFPRYIPPHSPTDEVPLLIKYAQIELAAALCDTKSIEKKEFYDNLKSYGIKSYSMGNLSETFSSTGAALSCATSAENLISARARQFVQPFLVKGVSIR